MLNVSHLNWFIKIANSLLSFPDNMLVTVFSTHSYWLLVSLLAPSKASGGIGSKMAALRAKHKKKKSFKKKKANATGRKLKNIALFGGGEVSENAAKVLSKSSRLPVFSPVTTGTKSMLNEDVSNVCISFYLNVAIKQTYLYHHCR